MKLFCVLVLTWLSVAAKAATLDSNALIFTGMCDASAAVALSNDLFAVASDEDNILRFYRLKSAGPPVESIDLKPILFGNSKKRKTPESDFEGAARVGDRVYFITSHGQNAEGKSAPLRHRFIALQFSETPNNVNVTLVGRPYTNLVADLSREPRLARFAFANAARRAPKTRDALNIEALTDMPNGSLLIGFRNPLFERKAIIIPLLNPNEVVHTQPPKFGDPILLDLGGLGLRGIGSAKTGYYLIAGPIDNEAECRLFTWDGGNTPPQLLKDVRFPGINPEAICFHDASGRADFYLFSDDGTRSIGGKDCKLLPESERRFRAFRLIP